MRERMRREGRDGAPGRAAGVLLLVAATAIWTLGCGNLTAGGIGEASVAVSGDAEEADQTSAPAQELTTVSGVSGTTSTLRMESPLSSTSGSVQGQVSATLRVYLEAADGDRIPLVGLNEQAQVDIQGQNEADLGTTELDAGLYPRIRMVFTDVQADVRSGLVIDGVEVTGLIDVGGENLDSLVVERTVDVEIQGGQRVGLVVDLNSTAWLSAAQPALMTVATSIFRQTVSVQVR